MLSQSVSTPVNCQYTYHARLVYVTWSLHKDYLGS